MINVDKLRHLTETTLEAECTGRPLEGIDKMTPEHYKEIFDKAQKLEDIKVVLTETVKCPYCGKHLTSSGNTTTSRVLRWAVVCPECGAQGPRKSSEREAFDALKKGISGDVPKAQTLLVVGPGWNAKYTLDKQPICADNTLTCLVIDDERDPIVSEGLIERLRQERDRRVDAEERIQKALEEIGQLCPVSSKDPTSTIYKCVTGLKGDQACPKTGPN